MRKTRRNLPARSSNNKGTSFNKGDAGRSLLPENHNLEVDSKDCDLRLQHISGVFCVLVAE